MGGAAFAAAELTAGWLLGRLPIWGRAEALLFLAFRPWLIVLAAALAAQARWRTRCAFYAAALILAAAAETILIVSLGATNPWPEMLRGLAGGAAVAVAADIVVQLARRFAPRVGAIMGAALLLGLFALGALRLYETLVLGPPPRAEAAAKPPLLLMSALPLVWGEGGAFDPASRPEPAFLYLQREYDVRAIDAIEPAALRGQRLMLLAQPRLLAPEELVALDAWVRSGGRLLVLTDPQLVWPSRWPPGDARRPPQTGLLAPLLEHWGLALEESTPGAVEANLAGRRLVLAAPGRFSANGNACRIAGRALFARCRLGRGEALLVADADLLDARLWAPAGTARHLRAADNPLIVADWLDRLAGLSRERVEPAVAWAEAGADDSRALLLAALPLLLALAAELGLLYSGRKRPTTLSTGMFTVNRSRTKELEAP